MRACFPRCDASSRSRSGVLTLFLSAILLVRGVLSRARLIEPPMRSSYWREGVPDASVNINDEQLNCGGFEYMWGQANGKCGACGDMFSGIIENEYPGKYSHVLPQRVYRSGKEINVTVYTSANMLGYFFFRLCPSRDGPNLADLDQCFQSRSPLEILETDNSTRYYPGSKGGFHDLHLLIPSNLSCPHCILQWNYVTGYKEHKVGGPCDTCMGCEPQERYVNCADIQILPEGVTWQTDGDANYPDNKANISTPSPIGTNSKPTTPAATVSPSTSYTAAQPTSRPSQTSSDTHRPCSPLADHVTCEARGIERLIPGVGNWCLRTCQSGNCRLDLCSCYCQYRGFKIHIDSSAFNWVASSKQFQPNQATKGGALCYKAMPLWSKTPGLNGWCAHNCPSEWCEDMCSLQVCTY